MLIGILSDTHDDMAAIKKAVDIFNAENVLCVIHAGDLTSPFTFEIFSELRCGLRGIFGNNDGDRLLLREKSGGNLSPQPVIMTLGEKKIVVVHEPDLVDALAESGRFDLVIYGHTHRPEIRKVRNTLVVNPGKVARLHKGESTLAVLDTGTMIAEILNIP